MKVFFTAVWAIICLVILFYGHSYWSDRTAVKAEIEKKAASPANKASKQTNEPNYDEFLAKAQNWPEAARQQFQQKLKQKKSFKILFVGSTALGNKDQGMLKDVIQQLNDSYGSDHLSIAVHTYDVTSSDFIAKNDQLEVAAEKAQLIVFEPFLLNDNNKGNVRDSLNNLIKVIGDVTRTNPDTTFILQPSYPLFAAKYYPIQVAKLKQYAAQNQITYLDHWTSWPASTDKTLNDYLLPGGSGPNDKGNQVWSQYLINFLIHK
ncbi:SGNH/GDSL hydrolase family protein [Neobacillus sp. PS3-12]|uniref:SGNH/GDSL hydrolase family protein n=1 Tax=Neobacillus sp. PS3-12 TaxID=3070677 RepID=UPI0027E0B333|nr:SGNH/GDSL hydrolase family protein [Neobacillus sp. PS3-12]WML55195.1 SGNH/GDSL hydrolase family protein [Neobacillus sp. PS3-12]